MTKPSTPTVPVAGSERNPIVDGRKLGAVQPEERLQVTVLVRRRHASSPALLAHLQSTPTVPVQMAHATFAAYFGADPTDLDQVEAFAHDNGLDVIDIKPAERRILLGGSAAAFSKAFGVTLDAYADHEGSRIYRIRSGAVHVPASLAAIVEGVFGLDDRPQARPHFRIRTPLAAGLLQHASRAAPAARTTTAGYTPPELANAYGFPNAGNGKGQCIAIIELGGGYKPAELNAYFTGLGLTPPKIKSRSIDGGRNHPSGDANSADGEVLLDIEVIGALASGATIVVYFAPNTDAGFLNAISSAIHDTANQPSVVSISWGGPESTWTAQAMKAMDGAFQDAAALGVTICCAAGDDGSSDERNAATGDGRLHADFPASSPFALACGGTRLESTAAGTTETVWNAGRSGGATGGGVSEFFARPAWQKDAAIPASANPGHHAGRGLPDVAANADPATGYVIHVDGQQMVIGGTSAVAPLYAALVALCNEQLGRRLGYLNPRLYRLPASAGAFRDIRGGDNDISGGHGAYASGTGWDACTGLGSVHGARLLAALKAG
ncbi:MAG: S8/S53 family peptidase [Herminiimonas sp.]|nr:S8/S53 family peptidase [Herminiimonas sp.]